MQKKKVKNNQKKLKVIENKVNVIEKCIEKIKKIKNVKNEKTICKQFIISKDEMDNFGKEELKKERKTVKNGWFDCLINHVPNPIKKLQAILKIRF